MSQSSNDATITRQKYPAGTKIKLISMFEESQMPAGLVGTVESIDDASQIHVRWENGSTLALIEGVDEFEVLK